MYNFFVIVFGVIISVNYGHGIGSSTHSPVVSIRLRHQNFHVCNGIMVTQGAFVTLSNCFYRKIDDYVVVFGREEIPLNPIYAPYANHTSRNHTEEFFLGLNKRISSRIYSVDTNSTYENNLFSNGLSEDEQDVMFKELMTGSKLFFDIAAKEVKENEFCGIRKIIQYGGHRISVGFLDCQPKMNFTIMTIKELDHNSSANTLNLTGWGTILDTTDNKTSMVEKIQKFNMKIIDESLNALRDNKKVIIAELVANKSDSRSPCYGFAGAPLFQNEILYGFLDYGNADCRPEDSISFIRLSYYQDFIDYCTMNSLEYYFHSTLLKLKQSLQRIKQFLMNLF
uniref:Putative trypsin-like salivary secreted protein n=1 Tax=Corethrella appendiculata TaxID=1370023 RepID=U5EQD1_9DIPT